MRALRVVGISEDDGEVRVVLEDPARHERFTVPADERLRAAARGDLTRLGQIAIELESQLRPREIQARIRAGASVEQVAATAGVPQQKIERFAYPVLLERSRTAEVAQRAHPVRAEGPDQRTLGDVVAHTFGLRGQEYTDAEWDSWKGEDGRWVVALRWRAGRSDNGAHWVYQPGAHGGTVTALDEHAGDLVEGLPARPLRTVGPVIDMARPEEGPDEPQPVESARSEPLRAAAGAYTNPKRTDRGATATPSATPAAPPPDGTDGRGPAADRPARQTAPEPRRPVPPPQRPGGGTDRAGEIAGEEGEAPAVEEQPERPVDSTTPEHRTSDPVTSDPEGVGGEQPAAETHTRDEPAADPPTGPAAPTRRTKKGKPVMPSWDEVLLGVRGQR